MAVKGNSVEIADGDAVPGTGDHTDFGSIDSNSAPLIRTFTIENTGAALLSLGANAVTLSGPHAADYTVSSQPVTSVASGGSTTFQISFNPSALGIRTAELSIANDDRDENPFNFKISGTRVNATPTLTAPSAPSVTEDDTNVALANDIQVADTDADDQTVAFTITGGTLTTGTAGIAFGGSGNGTSSFTAAGTLAALNAALDAATFTPTANLSGTNAGTISFTTHDGTVASSATSVSFDIIAVNDEPTLTATGTNPTFTEDGSAAVVYSSASASTVESGQTLTSFTMTLTNVNDGSSEILNLDGTAITLTNSTSGTTAGNSLSYSVSVTGTTATLSLSGGTLSTSALQTLINAISYQNNSNTPNTSNRVVTITSFTDSGASTGSHDNVNDNLSVSSTVTVVAANDRPLVSINSSTLAYTEDNAAIQIDASATVRDPEGDGEWDGGLIALEIQANDEAADEISISDTDGDGITISISGSDIFANGTDIGNLSHNGGVVTGDAQLDIYFNSDASNANVQEVFQSLRYRNASDNPGTSDRLIAIAVFDKTPSSTTVSRTISVTSLDNDAPTITTNSTLNINEAASAGISSVSHLSVSDADDDDATLLFTMTTNVSNGALKKSGSTVNQDGTFTQADLTAGNMTYVHDGTNTDSDSFIFKVSDDNSNELTNQTFSIDVRTRTQFALLDLPASSSTDNRDLNVDFTLLEAASPGTLKMTFTHTGGAADANAPHVITFATGFETATRHTAILDGTDLSSDANVFSVSSGDNDKLVDGAIYNVELQYQDEVLNTAAKTTSLSFTYDNITQLPTLASPATGSSDNASLQIDFTLPEAASPGTVKMTFAQTGGTVDANAPHILTFVTGFESAAQHTTILDGADLSTDANVFSVSSGVNDKLVNGAIYSVKLAYQDSQGNSASFLSHTSFTYDLITQTPTLSLPAVSSSDNASLAIDFTLPESASPGTAKMTFTRTGGVADVNTPHIITFKSGFESAAQHTTTLNGADLSTNANVFSVSSDGNDKLVNGAIYSVKMAYQDALENSETSSTNTIFTYDLNYAPSVTTQAVSSISKTTATGNGTVTDLGFPNPTQHGVCWNTGGSPTTADSKTTEGSASATGAFTSTISSLTPGTTYYVRAYASNTTDTSYGEEVSFTAHKEPSVITQAVSSISTTTATGNGNITDLGTPNPTQYGFCWNTGGSPTVWDSKTSEDAASATGAFTSDIIGLTDGITYHVRAYATNDAGTSYGSSVMFTTQTTPTVQARDVEFTEITSSQMDVSWTRGNGSNCIAFMKQTSGGTSSPIDNNSFDANPVFGDGTQIGSSGWYCVYKGTNDGVTVTGLEGGTTYLVFVCEYNGLAGSELYNTITSANNPGNEMTLLLPVLTTQAVSNITSTTAVGNGNVTNLGLPNPTQYGVCWSTSTSPTISDNKTEEGSVSSTGAFTSGMTGLISGETYFVRAYTINDGGTAYGNEMSFVTCTVPVVDLATLPTVYGQCSATVSTIPTATSDCAGTFHGTTSDPLSYNMQGTHTITWTYDDGRGNEIKQTQKVVIDDVTNPIAKTKDITVSLDASGNASISSSDIDNGSSDNCSISTMNLNKTEFDVSNVGENIITLSVKDIAGNLSSETAIVTIKAHSPVVTENQTFVISEDASNGTSIGSLLATDPLVGTSFSGWAIHTRNDEMMFEINSLTGEISLSDNSNLNFELKNSYILGISVSDGIIDSEEEEVMILIEDVNECPIANAGEEQTIIEHSTVQLDGSASSDPDGDDLTCTWTAPEGITLSDIHAAQPSFEAPDVVESGQLTFSLVVSDGEMTSEKSEVIINIDKLTGIVDLEEIAWSIKVFPNPSKGKFILELDQLSKDGAEVTLANLQGRRFLKKTVYNEKTEFNLSLVSGVYSIRVVQGGESISKKLIIQ